MRAFPSSECAYARREREIARKTRNYGIVLVLCFVAVGVIEQL